MRTEVLVTGATGLLGHAVRAVRPDAFFVGRGDCDLESLEGVRSLFKSRGPVSVLHLAAEAGGVKMNAEKNAELFERNIRINTNVLSVSRECGVKKLVSVLSGCAFRFYPDRVSTEEDLHKDLPYDGNLGYGYSKRALDVQTKLLWEKGVFNCTSITPVTMYGPYDNWDLDQGHVVGSLVHRCFLAKQGKKALEVWGSGNAVRQFVYAPDVARILIRALDVLNDPQTTIVAPDSGVTIKQLAEKIARAMEFDGPIIFNAGKPEGMAAKVMKSGRFSRTFDGFAFTPLEQGLKETARWFFSHYEGSRERISAR